MAVRYLPIPEFQAPNVNILGALAQGEAMQQNVLRQRVLENTLAEQERLRGVVTQPGFDLNKPEAVQQLTSAGALDEAIKLKASQDESRVRRAMEQNYVNEVLIRGKKFTLEEPSLRQIARKNAFEASSAELKNMQDGTALAQDLISRAAPDGSDWDQVSGNLRKLAPDLMVPDAFNPKWNERMMKTAKIYQSVAEEVAKEKAKSEIPKVIAPTENMPGMVVSPRGVSKLPEQPINAMTEEQPNLGQTAWGAEPPAPVVRRPTAMQGRLVNDMQLPPDVMALQQKMAEEEQVKRTAPIGREKEALGAYRFSNTLKNVGNTFIDLAKQNGVVVPGESAPDTFAALANKTTAGEILGKLDASERLALVDQLRSQVATAIPQFAAAAGLQSKNFDSDAEGKRLQAALANPDNIANISSAFRILNDLNSQFGTGKPLFESKKEEEKILKQRRGVAGETPKVSGVVNFEDLK